MAQNRFPDERITGEVIYSLSHLVSPRQSLIFGNHSGLVFLFPCRLCGRWEKEGKGSSLGANIWRWRRQDPFHQARNRVLSSLVHFPTFIGWEVGFFSLDGEESSKRLLITRLDTFSLQRKGMGSWKVDRVLANQSLFHDRGYTGHFQHSHCLVSLGGLHRQARVLS